MIPIGPKHFGAKGARYSLWMYESIWTKNDCALTYGDYNHERFLRAKHWPKDGWINDQMR